MQDADAVASQTAQVHNQNIQTINQHEANKAQMLSGASQNAANLTTGLYDKWANRKEAIMARISAAKAEARKAFGIGETNEANYQAINLSTPNYQWDPFSQEFSGFIPGADINPTNASSNSVADKYAEYAARFPQLAEKNPGALVKMAQTDLGIVDNSVPDWLTAPQAPAATRGNTGE
jgi:hypothetical protein